MTGDPRPTVKPLPCPWCGKKPYGPFKDGTGEWWVGCDEPNADHELTVFGGTRTDAVRRWNRWRKS